MEIRRASTCHPERAAVSAANEGSKSATPSAPPPPSRVIPDWRVLAGGAFQIILDWRRVQRFASIWRRIRTKPRGAKTAALPTVIVSERRSRESNDLNRRSPPHTPTRPFFSFCCKQSTFVESTLGSLLRHAWVALGPRLGHPRATQSQTQSHFRQRVARPLELP